MGAIHHHLEQALVRPPGPGMDQDRIGAPTSGLDLLRLAGQSRRGQAHRGQSRKGGHIQALGKHSPCPIQHPPGGLLRSWRAFGIMQRLAQAQLFEQGLGLAFHHLGILRFKRTVQGTVHEQRHEPHQQHGPKGEAQLQLAEDAAAIRWHGVPAPDPRHAGYG